MDKAYGKRVFHLDVVGVKLNPQFKLYSDEQIGSPRDIARMACKVIGGLDREAIAVFNMRTDGRPLSCHIAGVGTVDSCVAHPRELLKASLLTNAASIILAHNHPSGDVTPSRHDIEMTARMAKICNLMQINLLDHVIVSERNGLSYFSMYDKGIITKNANGSVDIDDRYFSQAAERSITYGEDNRRRDEPGKVR